MDKRVITDRGHRLPGSSHESISQDIETVCGTEDWESAVKKANRNSDLILALFILWWNNVSARFHRIPVILSKRRAIPKVIRIHQRSVPEIICAVDVEIFHCKNHNLVPLYTKVKSVGFCRVTYFFLILPLYTTRENFTRNNSNVIEMHTFSFNLSGLTKVLHSFLRIADIFMYSPSFSETITGVSWYCWKWMRSLKIPNKQQSGIFLKTLDAVVSPSPSNLKTTVDN